MRTAGGPTQMTNANLTHRYLWQPDAIDQLMADEQVTNPNAPGNVVFPLTDQEGAIHDLAAYNVASGLTSVVNHQVYDAFGKLLSSTNPSTGEAPTVTCLFGYTGQPTDPGGRSGLQNNLNRWYSPAGDALDEPKPARVRCAGDAKFLSVLRE